MAGREWFSAAELAALALPRMPTSKGKVIEKASREDWCRRDTEGLRWRAREGRGGGVEYHFSLLPVEAQIKIKLLDDGAPGGSAAGTCRKDVWAWFEGLPDKRKAVARERLRALDAVQALEESGVQRSVAIYEVARHLKISRASLYNWVDRVACIARHDWLAWLAPRHVGRTACAECSDDAWDFIKADYLRPAGPNFSDCFRRLTSVAAEKAWTIPSERTLMRRMEALPAALVVLAREGDDALKRLYPAQKRDRSVFHALDAVNADGHKWDVFVRWPEGDIGRPVMTCFQDLFSGKILSWRVDRSENQEMIRLAFGDVVERFGVPEHCYLDNGRGFASKWITGRTANRFRFKIKDDEPSGVMTTLGVQVHWTTPYSGQSKPIERAFRDFAQGLAKHPRFAGAWTGNTPMAKPSDYASSAVELDVFLETVAEGIAEHNAREGRRSVICNGRSFDAAFADSYARSPIRRATAEQQRLWLLAAEAVSVRGQDCAIEIMGNRYWGEFLLGHRGQKVTVRFDPQLLHADLHVYRLDGGYLGSAPCIEAVGFNDVDAARAHGRQRRAWMRAEKAKLAAERTMSIQEVAAMLPAPAAPAPPPAPRVIRLVHASAAVAAAPDYEVPAAQRAMLDGLAQLNAARRGAQLRVVPDEDADGGD